MNRIMDQNLKRERTFGHQIKFIGVNLSPNSQQYFRFYNEPDHGSKSEKGRGLLDIKILIKYIPFFMLTF